MRGIFNRKINFGERGSEAVELIPLVENSADSAQLALVAGCAMSSSADRWLYQQ
jgi:hypothetical protein